MRSRAVPGSCSPHSRPAGGALTHSGGCRSSPHPPHPYPLSRLGAEPGARPVPSSGRFGLFRVITVPTGRGAPHQTCGVVLRRSSRVRLSRVIRVRPDATPEPAGLRPATQNRSAKTRQKRTRQRPTRVCGSRGLPDDGARRRSRTLPARNETMIFESDPNSAEGDYHLRHPNPARVIAQNPETIRLRSSLLVSGTSECAVAHA